jgi:CubicO group peptidase (beta-lactamase class C family)
LFSAIQKEEATSMATPYYPGFGEAWERVDPSSAGFLPAKLADAVAFAEAHETTWPRSLYTPEGQYIGTAYVEEGPPHNEVIGIVRPRGGTSGVILRGGRIAAEWGDTNRADTTFSVAKSYIAIVAMLALGDGVIPSLDARVADTAPDNGFDDPHNAQITWRQLLEQTSEWRGTLWDKPDSVDHNRQAGVTHDNASKGTVRELGTPGTKWEYNDVRVNRLALSLLRALKRPLPDVLKERIMDPIGASQDWEWRGYRNSSIMIDGQMMESVSGGGHWGGGLFISARDHARVGLLMQRHGVWNEQKLLKKESLDALAHPSHANPLYGFMWWLNTDRKLFPSAPDTSIFALGGGQHVIWVDRQRDLTVVLRWIERDQTDALFARIMESLDE